jgi:hypothetical protein
MIKAIKEKERQLAKIDRFNKTLIFIQSSETQPVNILDLGVANELSAFLRENGYSVKNTQGQDMDEFPEVAGEIGFDTVTAFEILEHLVNPLSVLKSIKAQHLFASVPLQMPFSKAYRNKNDPWDQHFHEFEDWQFDWLIEKAGWVIVRKEKWKTVVLTPGIRPLLRKFIPRYYMIEARRK